MFDLSFFFSLEILLLWSFLSEFWDRVICRLPPVTSSSCSIAPLQTIFWDSQSSIKAIEAKLEVRVSANNFASVKENKRIMIIISVKCSNTSNLLPRRLAKLHKSHLIVNNLTFILCTKMGLEVENFVGIYCPWG